MKYCHAVKDNLVSEKLRSAFVSVPRRISGNESENDVIPNLTGMDVSIPWGHTLKQY